MKDKLKAFLKKKDIEVSVKRYGIDALGAIAQGLFLSEQYLIRSVHSFILASLQTLLLL